ncbi:hypothetical protein O5967_11195 [Escherichia coli]|nr:hypothetical protein [Escherichia coli]
MPVTAGISATTWPGVRHCRSRSYIWEWITARWGAGSEYLVGRHLAGGVVGLRGQLFSTDYDVFIGRPFSKPAGFMTSDVTAGFNLFRDF